MPSDPKTCAICGDPDDDGSVAYGCEVCGQVFCGNCIQEDGHQGYPVCLECEHPEASQ